MPHLTQLRIGRTSWLTSFEPDQFLPLLYASTFPKLGRHLVNAKLGMRQTASSRDLAHVLDTDEIGAAVWVIGHLIYPPLIREAPEPL